MVTIFAKKSANFASYFLVELYKYNTSACTVRCPCDNKILSMMEDVWKGVPPVGNNGLNT